MTADTSSRYPQWKVDLFRTGMDARRGERSMLPPGVIHDFPARVFDDPVAAEGRSIAENDAIQAEHRP
jgi:hypothetical protein